MFRELLDVQRRVLGPEHPGTLATMNNLASSLIGHGKHAEARQMQHELLDVMRRVLGPEHPLTLTTISNFGFSLRRKGKHAEAEQMFHELLDVRRRVLGPEHPDTLATVRNLASLGSIRCVSTSIGPSVSRTLTTSHPADSEDGVAAAVHSHEPRSKFGAAGSASGRTAGEASVAMMASCVHRSRKARQAPSSRRGTAFA